MTALNFNDMRNTAASLFAFCLIWCGFAGCKRGPLPQVPERKNQFEKQVFMNTADETSLTLISPAQCEFDMGRQIGIVLGEYAREGNRLRVVVQALGTASVRYFDIVDDGLMDPKTGDRFILQESILDEEAKLRSASREHPYVNSLGMKFVAVPITGGPTAGQQVLFGIWDTRVQDYEAFVKATNRTWLKPKFTQGPTHPAVNVSWDDAQEFCKWLSTREQARGKLSVNYRYRLPSDHEWSCAVGLDESKNVSASPKDKNLKIPDVFPWGVEWPPPHGAGNYRPSLETDNFDGTSPVGSFAANRFGLYDMGGNVWQWCEDSYDGAQISRVMRGGSWLFDDRDTLLSSTRFNLSTADRNFNLGFRCVVESSAR